MERHSFNDLFPDVNLDSLSRDYPSHSAPSVKPDSTAADRQEKLMKKSIAEEQKLNKTTSAIHRELESLRHDLSEEQTQRQQADEANMRYTKKHDRINLVVAVFAALAAVGSLALQIFALFQ